MQFHSRPPNDLDMISDSDKDLKRLEKLTEIRLDTSEIQWIVNVQRRRVERGRNRNRLDRVAFARAGAVTLHKSRLDWVQAGRGINVANEFGLSLLFRHGDALRASTVIDPCVADVGTDRIPRSDRIICASQNQAAGALTTTVAVCTRIEREADSIWAHSSVQS
jgi:hypothetical protein